MKDSLDRVQYVLVPSQLTQLPTPSPDSDNTCSLHHVLLPVKIKRQTIKQLEHTFDQVIVLPTPQNKNVHCCLFSSIFT